ncbi:GNAT family N-acetyltransferase [Actinomycetospora sp. CA-101289]|uniref:GNAT family N-acetyltransferase n=1 Tax=Actinomycetospora sp. CA-101289 TaxID=3239893 RepID=UPI003D97C56F
MGDENDVRVDVDLDGDSAVLRVDGTEAGHMDMHHRHGDGDAPAAVVLVHTEVDDAYEGRGLASRLVRAVFEAARAAGAPVVPRCPYVQHWLGSHPEYLADVPADDRRALGLAAPTEEAS